MKTAKITEITKVNKRDKGEHWPIYYISMKLDNNELITLWKKKEDAFKVGDTVNYEVVEEWKKRKEVKENPFRPRAYNPEGQNKGAMIWMAMKLAFEMMYDKSKDNYKETYNLAVRIYEDAMELYNREEKSDRVIAEDSTENDELPF